MAAHSGRTFTLTFGDQAENHAGMQKIGTPASAGFTVDELQTITDTLKGQGLTVWLFSLPSLLPESIRADPNIEDASILVIPDGVKLFLGDDSSNLFGELASLEMDKQALMRGKVVNKRARHNLCFGPEAQEPDYESGKGRIIPYIQVPLTDRIRSTLSTLFGDKADDLVVEINDYFDVTKCGIGFHGDTERRIVIGARSGATIPLHFQWFYQCKPVGDRAIITLKDGDMYIMSQKAVGFDWKRRSQYTLRHAAGCEKYTTIK